MLFKHASQEMRKTAAGSNFEVQLGQLADAELSQNAPSLTPFKVGFQLIEKNDDETRGVGVMVYKLEKTWAYVPVFYLNGRLRGTEEMFLPGRSQFCPSSENWIVFVKGKQSQTLGKPEDDKKVMRGRAASVNIVRNVDPFMKSASEDIEGLVSLSALESMVKGGEGYKPDMLDLTLWLPRLGKTAAATFINTMDKDPDFANAVLKYYDADDLRMIAKKASEGWNPAKQDELVKVITPESPEAVNLKPLEKEALVKDRVFVMDSRKETSTVFKGDVDHKKLSSPTKFGVHDVLMSDGTFNRFCAVFPKNAASVSKSIDDKSGMYLIPMDDEEKEAIQGSPSIQAAKVDSKEWDDGLKTSIGKPISSIRDDIKGGDKLILIDGFGDGWIVYLDKNMTAVGGKYAVSDHEYSSGNNNIARLDNSNRLKWLEKTNKEGHIFRAGDTLFVPKNTRYVRVGYNSGKYSFGSPNTLINELKTKLNLKPMKVYSDGTTVQLMYGDGKTGEALSKSAALIELVKRHGVDAPTAKRMVKEASRHNRPHADRYLIKYAADYPGTLDPVTGGTQAPYDYQENVVGGPGLMDTQQAVEASNRGVKDVMDVSILKSLAASGKALNLVDDYLPDFMGALDKLGRMLFLFYWHNDEFKDRYGSEEMTDLESSLRDVFRSLGDLVLFLHKKTVSPSGALESLSGDLAEDLGT